MQNDEDLFVKPHLHKTICCTPFFSRNLNFKCQNMVHKKINYGNVENVIVAEFGKGTLSVVDGTNDGYLSLLIKTKEFSPIGEVSGSEKSSDDFKPELVLAFHNAASFEVFYEYVENIREKFQSALNSEVPS
jgi:hypothetical protein